MANAAPKVLVTPTGEGNVLRAALHGIK